MAKGKSNGKRVPVSSLKHKDKRTNIPTRELQNFVKDEEKSPKTVSYPGLLYARDPSLDPQLVWKGKDEQDQKPLEVPAVPVYIQEKIHPQAIVEQVKAEARKTTPRMADLFADFNNIKFEDLVDFYRHEQNWSNRMILGDSLLVMTSLAEKEGLKGKVQMIYIDPPNGIKFGSNWQVSTRKRDVKDGKAEDAVRQPEQIKAFRDTWEYGVHSYLTYLRDRFTVARELLSETGSVFVQIGDENVHLVRSLMDEVFGADNAAGLVAFRKTSGETDALLGSVCDYLVWYAKDKSRAKFRQPYVDKTLGEEGTTQFVNLESPDRLEWRRMSREEREGTSQPPPGWTPLQIGDMTSMTGSEASRFPYSLCGAAYVPGARRGWSTNLRGLDRIAFAGRLVGIGKSLMVKRRFEDFAVSPIGLFWRDTVMTGFTEDKTYVVQTATRVIERCVLMTTDPGDLVLDPTCGGGTTAYVAEQWGRRWITIDTSRVALALARTRLMAAKFLYFLLADSPDGVRKVAEIEGRMPPDPTPKTGGDIRKGLA
ncbi:MAG: site-specific DNA-methyltransferase [candidate division WOR-3 bacterium]|nr:site-specific DNA-methyltransferase [candidate division WOR-3 bacterium]